MDTLKLVDQTQTSFKLSAWRHDIQHNDIHQNDTQHNGIQHNNK
jgi:hypothetical protein